ncbi:hypothetical protein BMF94_2396 [Rhodotorula taiwanensis]|uniref:Proteophosphoglycan ppg4 n=1 Tax=Rhodotorula taiwanensis TaxID=741276 RepID=A0A2S5BCY0_9BASI|nr:hypothetical protein BMF94_2396 [Rhodotorula taiwanensis]
MSVSLPSYQRIPTSSDADSKPLPARPAASGPVASSPHLKQAASAGTAATGPTPRVRRTLMSIRRNQLAVAACAGLLVLTLLWGNRSDSPSSSRSAKTASSRKATTPEWSCNPFEANGRLQYDPDVQENNVWVPFDSRCKPSNMMSDLASSHGKRSATALPWFANRTIVIHSDSIDRYHLRDFCDFVGGKLTNINPEHPASPPMYRDPAADAERRKLEDQWSKRPTEGWELTTPWVCDVQRYGATLVNVFTFGLEGAESFFQSERWYYPPARWDDRLEEITLPLLRKIASHFKRPQIVYPDLVVLNSGYWDLRRYTEEDFVAAGFTSRPYPEDSPIPYTPLSDERMQRWEREARSAIKLAARSFVGEKSRKAKDGPTLLWRTLHHPPRHNYAPFPRVEALDSLSRKVVSDLRASQDLASSLDSAPRPPSRSFFSSSPAARSLTEGPSPPLDPTLAWKEPREPEPLGLERRLRIDNSGRLMLGQEHLFRDLLHPLPMPGSWLWGSVVLYELKRAVEGVDR